MPTNRENAAVATGLEKVSFHSNPKERQCQRMFKLPHIITHLTCWQSNAKFSKPGFNSTWTMNFQMFKLDLEKGRGIRDQIANICWIIVKAREFQKNIYFCFLDYERQSLWQCASQQTVENSSRDGNTRPPNLPPKKSVCSSRSNS